ncbi:wall-associated receptor kinase-like 1 [Prunus persica]|uniref:wall-associated receptor kinase-like 1 n=1 Tax=Prunus persica TaxID=3760 RepID=UPI0009AB4255|nr:wall-associated receptor kinase-like 1 [Prunus persica]
MQFLLHMIILLLWLISRASSSSSSDQLAAIAKPNCETHCGDVTIPYPFGIGPSSNCYLYDWFEIECDYTTIPPRPFLRLAKLELLNISIDGTLWVNNPVTFFYGGKGIRKVAPNLTGSPFVYSERYNRLTAVSCGFFLVVRSDENVVGGCMSTCDKNYHSRGNYGCIGINCCQTTLPAYLTAITIELQAENEEATGGNDHMGMGTGTRTGMGMDDYNYAFMVDRDWFEINFSNFTFVKDKGSVPVVLEWRFIVNTSISHMWNFLFRDPTPYCRTYDANHFMKFNHYNHSELKCFCPPGFEGSPYLLQPCQDIDECKGSNPCMSSLANPTTWKFGFGTTCENLAGGPGMSLGLLLLFIYVYKCIKKRKKIKRRETFFKRNGGLLLEQQLSSNKVHVQKIKLFKSKELERSTDNFKINRILGHGGQGTVYKGMLADGRIVAIKKSKIVDEGKLSEFINEVVVLSQINHRNVVKVLGCCLETEVPLLVYEFIPNGTLAEYIQGQVEEFPLTWEMRLRIATEIAGALSYLHGAASFPIFHRDIKSTNILLDEKYRAKVADFGTSRSVSVDQTHVTTLVNGTFGYLDPEYFHSNRFTEKSDVYSFGVVLVELLTGQKPVCAVLRSQEDEYRSLSTHFIISMQEDRLFDIVDPRILKEGSKRGIKVFASLAGRCLNANGRNRPTMREVTTKLEAIQKSETTYNGAQPNYEGV